MTVLVEPGSDEDTRVTLEGIAAVGGPDDQVLAGRWWDVAETVASPFVLLLRAGDKVEPGALRVLEEFAQRSRSDLVTCDRREAGAVHRCQRWSMMLFEQLPYTGRAMLVRTDVVQRAVLTLSGTAPTSEWDAQLRLVEAASKVDHCPVVLVDQAEPVRTGARVDRLDTARRHLERVGVSADVELGAAGWPRVRASSVATVSVVVPTAFAEALLADGSRRVLVELLLASLAETAGPSLYEVVLVTDHAASQSSLDRCVALLPGRIRLVRTEGPFSFSRAVNAGVLASRGDVVLLLNDDVEPLAAGWMENMLGALSRPEIGVVGARLLYEDGTIQHLGVVCPPDALPMHPRIFEMDDPRHAMAQADVPYLAVTGACLMCRREDLIAVGGMTEELPLNFNDVDLCLKISERDLAVICVNSARLLHRESSTRNARLTAGEVVSMVRWRHRVLADPHIEYWG